MMKDLDPFSIDQRFYICVHEAGHVVAARAFGLPVAWVSVDPSFLTSNSLAIENECASGQPVSMVLAVEALSPILRRGFTLSAQEREIVRGYCVEVLAGPLAEEKLNPLFELHVGAMDYAQVRHVVERLERDKFKRQRKLVGFIKEARAFVQENGAAIIAFANELYQRKTIEGEDIDRILSNPTALIDLPVLTSIA
jgi:hypothetical protein